MGKPKAEKREFEGVASESLHDGEFQCWIIDSGYYVSTDIEWFKGFQGKKVRITVEEIE